MKNNMICDVKTAVNIFSHMRKARKQGREVKVEHRIQIPVIDCVGFYGTVEGCTLSWLDRDIVDKARDAFDRLPYDEKLKLQSIPEKGEFIKRARLWKELLSPVMTRKQCHIAMIRIIGWYIHIKTDLN